MKKLALATALVLMASSVALPSSAQQSSGGGMVGSAPAQQPAASAPAQQKTIKDPAEYNAYIAAAGQTDPGTKATALEQFLTQYPGTVMKEEVLEGLMGAYQQKGDTAKMGDAANRVLQANPANIRALALLVYTKSAAAEAGQNSQQNFAEARQLSQRGLQQLPSMPKPDGVSDADFEKLKTQMGIIFNGTIGFAALQTKEYAVAQQSLKTAVDANPADFTNTYRLALAYLTATPSDDLNGLWYLARAVNMAPPQAQAQLTDFGRKRYIKFHGGEDGWNELLAQARTSPTPPAGFAIKAAPSPAETAQKVLSENTPAKLNFSDMEFILTSGYEQGANQVMDYLKGLGITRMKGKVITASRTEMQIAVSPEAQQENRADVDVMFSSPAKAAPASGSMIDFTGKVDSFTPSPLMIKMTEGGLVAAPAAGKPKPSATKKKPVARRKR